LLDQGCDAELVCLPVDESTFEGIQQGYRNFAELDLSAYDLVISTKAPSYAASHPNHVLYLVHTVRVFYDMFADVFPHAGEELKAQQSWVHQQDNKALAQIKQRFSIGTEVSKRLVEWNNYDAEVIHPPMDLDGLYNAGTGDYFYMPGRLHAWKRVDLAIKAIKCSSLPMKLIISGMGDAEQQLRDLAAGDSRIEFAGRVDDETLKRLYAGALAVPFLPIREDYGYITLEAFTSGKPVITCTDSGEPQVFVEHGVSGFVCAPEPQSVCDAFERLWEDRTLAARMGSAGRERVSSINWKTVSGILLRAGFPEIKTPVVNIKAPLKVAVLDMQPIIPAVGGGRLRLLGLYHALGEGVQARYIGSYDWPGEKYRRHSITPTFEEIDVPLSAEHHAAAAESARQAGGKTVIDMLFPQQGHLSPEYLQEVFDAVEWAEVVVFSHPWIAPLVSDARLAGKTVIYDSQNVESELRSQLLDLNRPFEKNVLDEVIRAEKLVGDRADIVLACSQEDIDGFVTRFGWRASKLKLVPNGVFSDVIQPPTQQQKAAARQALGLSSDEKVAFFIGSNYAPNIEAGLFIVEELAHEHPDCLFAIGGGVCSKLAQKLLKNVRSIGFLEEEDKVRWLHASDVAINPMFSGSGTNIKMFDFMSAALPVVTTPTGARGITSISTDGIYLAERAGVSALLGRVLNNPEALAAGGEENRRVVKERFSWEAISPALGETVRTTHLRKQGVALLSSTDQASAIRVAHLSTVGLKCGIGEYTRKLIAVYQARGVSNFLLAAEAANEKPTLSGLDIPVDTVWFFDNVTWNSSRIDPRALQRLLEWQATHLVIQYHPGYYPSEMLIDFAKAAKSNGVAVTVIVHNFVDETAAVMRRLNALGITLFSHRTTEVLQAKAVGVQLEKVPLAMEFKEGARAQGLAPRDWRLQPPVIVTTGFLRRHKGVVSLIRSMPDVLEKFPGAQLVIQCALYPSEDSESEVMACESEIKRLKLADAVRLDTRFLDKDVVLGELAKADLAVLPYEQSNEGGSATAADCMCVGLPLIVSDAEIFDEVRAVAFTVQPNVKAISAGIIEVLSRPELYVTLEQNSIAHAQENSWGNFAGGFLLG
jgi:glycosyltransferase involved in cell wall biosynthesis